jgi:outer membrane receptor protein involved in Fe transport
VSAYSINKYTDVLDATRSQSARARTFFGVSGAANYEDWQTDKFTQEIRLAAPLGDRFEWLAGAFYDRDESDLATDIRAVDPATGAPVGQLLYQVGSISFEEYAAFANLTFHVTERFDIQAGGRASRNEQQRETPALFGPIAGAPTVGESQDDAFTYLLTPRLRLSADLMVYARLASGYRPGSFNSRALAGAPAGLPLSYEPDKTFSYELGAKGNVLDHALSFDLSLYHIDWKDIQILQLLPGGIGFTGNVGRARSRGVELMVESKPVRGMTLAAWAVRSDAELTENFPPPPQSAAFGVAGDRLPYSSRFSGSISLDQEFLLGSALSGSVGAAVSYVGDRRGVFTSSALRERLPAYARTDVRAALKYQSWTFNVFVNNVTDRRGVLTGGLGTSIPFAFYYIQPRTAGVSLSKSFGR